MRAVWHASSLSFTQAWLPGHLTRNIDQRAGHCNGTKYVVVNIKPHVLELRSVDTYNRGATILLPRIISISKTKTLPFTLRRKQFPVKLAYGITANKV